MTAFLSPATTAPLRPRTTAKHDTLRHTIRYATNPTRNPLRHSIRLPLRSAT